MVEYSADESTVPKESLGRQVVDTEGTAEFDISDGLVEREVGGKEGDEDVATRPILDVFVKDDLVAKNLDFNCPSGALYETYTEDDGGPARLCCDGDV